jgi:hypothetical protein
MPSIAADVHRKRLASVRRMLVYSYSHARCGWSEQPEDDAALTPEFRTEARRRICRQ